MAPAGAATAIQAPRRVLVCPGAADPPPGTWARHRKHLHHATPFRGRIGQRRVIAAAPPRPFVSIIVPVLNEENYIEACLDSLVRSAAGMEFEVLVMDGGSSDGTPGIVRAFAVREPRVSLHANPGRLQSAGFNRGAAIASPRAGVLVRADAHALYPRDFIANCLAALLGHDVASVVVPMVNHGGVGLQRAIAAAQSSRLGNGGSAHRTGGVSGLVEHGHHAAFRREAFLALGGYDAGFSHNEDAELDVRLNRSGQRIWMCREAPVTYFPRRSFRALARQYYNHGRGRARTLMLHRIRPRPRQLAPLGILAACVAALLLGLWNRWFLLVPASYAALCLAWAAAASLRARDPWLLAAGPALVVVHLGWACGFLAQLAGGAGRSPPRAA